MYDTIIESVGLYAAELCKTNKKIGDVAYSQQ